MSHDLGIEQSQHRDARDYLEARPLEIRIGSNPLKR
jgi:hypothetical protein